MLLARCSCSVRGRQELCKTDQVVEIRKGKSQQQRQPGSQLLITLLSLTCAALIVSIETVADPRNGEDEARMCGVRFDFPAQLADVNMQVMRLGTITGPPYLGKQHMARHDFATILDKRLEQIILRRCQLDLLSIDLHQPLRKINPQWPSNKDRLRSRLDLGCMTQCYTYACQDLIHAKRFRDIVVGAQVERHDLVTFTIFYCHHADRQIS